MDTIFILAHQSTVRVSNNSAFRVCENIQMKSVSTKAFGPLLWYFRLWLCASLLLLQSEHYYFNIHLWIFFQCKNGKETGNWSSLASQPTGDQDLLNIVSSGIGRASSWRINDYGCFHTIVWITFTFVNLVVFSSVYLFFQTENNMYHFKLCKNALSAY